MKKLILMICMFFACMGVGFAQQGIQSVGVHLSYGTEIENVGLGIKYQYNLTNAIRFEPSMEYFFKKNNVDMYDINMNVHYIFPIQNQVRVYPLAGLTYTHWSLDMGEIEGIDVNANKSKFGANLGGGIEFDIANNWMVNFEAKYQLISDFDQAVFNIGLAYMF